MKYKSKVCILDSLKHLPLPKAKLQQCEKCVTSVATCMFQKATKQYAFEIEDVPAESDYLEVQYSVSD